MLIEPKAPPAITQAVPRGDDSAVPGGLLYLHEPPDLRTFWDSYPYFDPDIIAGDSQRYHFLGLVELREQPSLLRERLNQYLNVKFNPVGSYRLLEANMENFVRMAEEASAVLANILRRAHLPPRIEAALRESDRVSSTNRIVDLIDLYAQAADTKVKYEITRKIGLTFLLSRVRNAPVFQKSQLRHEYLEGLVRSQLGIAHEAEAREQFVVWFWLNSDENLCWERDEEGARRGYGSDGEDRLRAGKLVYPLQAETFSPEKTAAGNRVLQVRLRMKHRCGEREDYTSVIEKMIRKNILHPTDINDIFGVTFVVEDENAGRGLKAELEMFLGGTNTRKEEKVIQKAATNAEPVFPSSGEFFRIWKAVYDVTLPNEELETIRRELVRLDEDLALWRRALEQGIPQPACGDFRDLLSSHLEKRSAEIRRLKAQQETLENAPFDIYVEIQIQELRSYLLSICPGSATEHEALKRDQVRASTLYKLFPRRVYQDHVNRFGV